MHLLSEPFVRVANLVACCSVGTPVNRIPIMAKQVLDLYMLYQLVTEKGGLVEVINKKLWREITKGLNLPTSITSAAFTLRTQYVHKHLRTCVDPVPDMSIWRSYALIEKQCSGRSSEG